MKVVSIWNPKGGQAKSLIALNLAAAAVAVHDMKPFVLCRDPQGTTTLAFKEGNLPFMVDSHFPTDNEDYDLVIADHVAADWEVPPAPTIIIPTKADRSQYATFVDALGRAEKATKPKRRIIQVITDGNSLLPLERSVIKAMKRAGAFEIHRSGIFSKAAAEYRSIFDPTMNKSYRVKDSRQEFEAILTAVLSSQSSVKDHQPKKEKAHA